jgi:hypothetical protein
MAVTVDVYRVQLFDYFFPSLDASWRCCLPRHSPFDWDAPSASFTPEPPALFRVDTVYA